MSRDGRVMKDRSLGLGMDNLGRQDEQTAGNWKECHAR